MNLIARDTAQALPLTAWLEVLSAVFPPRGVVVVGAGTGQGPWVQWLRSRRVSQVCLVEGDETQYWHLQRHVPEGCEWSLRLDVVAAQPGPTVFYRASNAAESGLIEPERLRPLWPNLAQDAALEVEAPITLEALLADAGEQTNWLVLDCLPAAPLLEGAAARVSQLDVIAVRVAASAQAGVDADALHPTVDARLKSAGFVCVRTRAERHPALAQALYVRDPAALQAQWAQAHAQAAQRLSQVEALSRAMQATQQALEEARAEHAQQPQQAQQKAQERERQWQHDTENLRAAAAVAEQARAELQTQLDQARERSVVLENTLSETQQALEQAKRDYTLAIEQLQADTHQQERAWLERLFESSHIKLDQWGQSIGRTVQHEMANAVKQIEAFATLQGYLATGDLMPAFHGWPISPDFGLLIVELLERQSFDAVIEFGSGSSTLLVARALEHIAKKYPDRKRPIQVAFEHLPEFHDTTAELLRRSGLRDKVILVLAPLKPMTLASGDVASFYDPGNALAEVAQLLENSVAPRILAIVDGPPESIGPIARYPSLELLLEVFPRQHGYFLLDDYRRPEEQQTIKMWNEFLRASQIEPIQVEYELEKKACLIEFDASQRVIERDAS